MAKLEQTLSKLVEGREKIEFLSAAAAQAVTVSYACVRGSVCPYMNVHGGLRQFVKVCECS